MIYLDGQIERERQIDGQRNMEKQIEKDRQIRDTNRQIDRKGWIDRWRKKD